MRDLIRWCAEYAWDWWWRDRVAAERLDAIEVTFTEVERSLVRWRKSLPQLLLRPRAPWLAGEAHSHFAGAFLQPSRQ